MKIEKQTLSGLIGPVVAVSNPDGTFLRSRPSYLNDPKTSAQLQQRSKMQQVQDFIKPLLPFAKAYYLEPDARHNYYNALVSWLLYGAFDAENILQAAKARIMHGSLTPPENATMCNENGNITLSWDDNTMAPLSEADDHLVWCCYNTEAGTCQFEECGSITRSSGNGTINLRRNSHGGHLYLAFINKKHDRISDSVYLGEVEL